MGTVSSAYIGSPSGSMKFQIPQHHVTPLSQLPCQPRREAGSSSVNNPSKLRSDWGSYSLQTPLSSSGVNSRIKQAQFLRRRPPCQSRHEGTGSIDLSSMDPRHCALIVVLQHGPHEEAGRARHEGARRGLRQQQAAGQVREGRGLDSGLTAPPHPSSPEAAAVCPPQTR